MAYLRLLIIEYCDARPCTRRATVQLLNRYNGNNGHFCAACGKKALRRLEAEEQKNNR